MTRKKYHKLRTKSYLVYSLSDSNRYSSTEQILSLPCLPISPSELMVQKEVVLQMIITVAYL